MLLQDKLKLLRSLEGSLRGLGRPLTKSEVARLLQEEHGATLSQAYLSQLEAGKREHMTATSRALLSTFFKVHPGYLVSDPEGFQNDLSTSQLMEGRLDGWLEAAAQDLESQDSELASALRELASHNATRKIVLILARLVKHPDLLVRLQSCVNPDSPEYTLPSTADAPPQASRNKKGSRS